MNKSGTNYRSTIAAYGRTRHVGTFCTAERAALAVDLALVLVSGDAANTNFPLADYEAEIKSRHEVRSQRDVYTA